MKKIYNQPTTKVVKIQIMHMIADSIGVNNTQLSGSKAGWAREDNSWDIWGSGDDEE